VKNFNRPTFIFATIFFGLLLVPSFFATWAQDEGTLGTNMLAQAFAAFFNVLRFPTHTLFWSVIANGGVLLFFAGLFINCLFYGLITERIFSIIDTILFTKL
jgi:hypothetical protein